VTRTTVRVIDHHSFPEFSRVLDCARDSVNAEQRAAALEASRVLALVISGLTSAESLLVSHGGEKRGLTTVPLKTGRKGEAALAFLGPFAGFLRFADDLGGEAGTLPEVASEIRGAVYRYREPRFTVPLAGGGELTLGERTLVMGILNVTPDSFSDGGDFLDPDRAIEQAERMIAEGADIIDVGGESTRPGAAPVKADEERERVLPVIEALAMSIDVPVSIDTRRGSVARDALVAGARMVNDVSGLADPLTAAVAARAGASIVIMHMRGTPEDMGTKTDYRDLMGEVMAELQTSLDRAREAGLPDEALLVDPGIGFAKTADQSREMIRRLAELKTLGRPIVAGPSRKSFLATVRDVPPPERVNLTIGAVLACIQRGARIVRVHDVGPVVDAIRAFEACS